MTRTKLALIGWLPLVVLLVVMGVFGREMSATIVEPPALVLPLYQLFVLPVAIAIAVLAGRGYLVGGDLSLLWLGSGALLWGSCGLVAWLLVPRDLNAGVTAHNVLAWLSAACHLAGVLVSARPAPAHPATPRRLWAAYALAMASVVVVTAIVVARVTPTFFILGVGGTSIRQLVVVSALLMFAAAAGLLMQGRRASATSFAYWYSLAMLLIACGLLAILIQASPRSIMGWLGRMAQVLGTGYMLLALIATARQAHDRGDPIAIAMREAERRFDDLIDMVGDGILVHELPTPSRPGRLVRANAALCALLGYSANELARMTPDAIVAPESRVEPPEAAAVPANGGHSTYEQLLVARDGRRIPVANTTRQFRRAGRVMVVSVIHDLSERVRAETHRAQLAAIVESSEDAIVSETLDGVITSWNRGAERIFGYAAHEAIGKAGTMLFPPDGCDAEQTMRTLFEQGQQLLNLDTLRIRKDGSPIEVSISISPVRDGSGQVIGISKIARDNTARKEAEKLLAQAKDAAEEASRAKSTFLTNISHEIRTPMHNIIGLAHSLLRDGTDPAQRRRLEQLCASSDHMLAVINDVLDMARIEANRLVPENRDFLLGVVIDRVAAVTSDLARAKGLRLAVEMATELRHAALHGDALRLGQVLINLMGNAVKFTDRGAVTLAVSCAAEDAQSVRLRFAVSDTGVGIAPEDHGRIFKAFEQGDPSARRPQGGSGLGLAICDRLIRAMGGKIGVRSQPGAGSTFDFELVFVRGLPVAAAGPEATGGDWRFSGSRVLVAEDHPLSRELLREMLADLGCTVDLAHDGLAAVERAREVLYDVILMDIQLPKLDGLAAARAIRTLPEHSHTPILALTANAFVEDREQCLAAGMNGHISKPATRATLALELSNWLATAEDPAGPSPDDGHHAANLGTAAPELDGGAMLAGVHAGADLREGLFAAYVRLHRHDVVSLRDHVANGQYAAARELVHTLEGSAAMVGARGIRAAAAALAAALRADSDAATCRQLALACEREFDALAASLSIVANAAGEGPGDGRGAAACA